MKKIRFFQIMALVLMGWGSLSAQSYCTDSLRAAELAPYGTRFCLGKKGNYLQRTVCNSEPGTNFITLPAGKTAGCFVIVGYSGRPDWKIYDAAGAVVFDPVMPTTAPRLGRLTLAGGQVYTIKLNRATSSPSSWITLGFVDYP